MPFTVDDKSKLAKDPMNDPTKTNCYCNLCKYWSKVVKRVRHKLSGKLLKDFDTWCDHMACEGLDGSVAEAKLDGSWPGWEWLPAEITKRNKAMGKLRNATPLSPRGSR